MRILQVIKVPERPGRYHDPAVGAYGSQRSTTLLCQGLSARGHQIQLTCQHNDPTVEVARGAGVRVQEMKPKSSGSLRVIGHLMRQALQQRSDLIVSHDLRSSRIVAVVGRILRTPTIGTMRGLYPLKGYSGCTHLIAVSEGVRQYVLEHGASPDWVSTVHNGVDVERFVPPGDVRAAKKAVKFDEDSVVMGLIARMSHEKGHDWFFAAAAPLAQEFPNARFLLVGDGILRPKLEAQVETLGMAAQTKFVGYQSDILPWMSAMDTLVLPSMSAEGFARVLIEAGALQKPAIASPVGGNAEAVVDGETGYIVPVGDVAALRHAMRVLFNDAEKRNLMGIKAMQRVKANFTVDRMVEETERVYRKVIRN